jgi:hypothetical protein
MACPSSSASPPCPDNWPNQQQAYSTTSLLNNKPNQQAYLNNEDEVVAWPALHHQHSLPVLTRVLALQLKKSKKKIFVNSV